MIRNFLFSFLTLIAISSYADEIYRTEYFQDANRTLIRVREWTHVTQYAVQTMDKMVLIGGKWEWRPLANLSLYKAHLGQVHQVQPVGKDGYLVLYSVITPAPEFYRTRYEQLQRANAETYGKIFGELIAKKLDRKVFLLLVDTDGRSLNTIDIPTTAELLPNQISLSDEAPKIEVTADGRLFSTISVGTEVWKTTDYQLEYVVDLGRVGKKEAREKLVAHKWQGLPKEVTEISSNGAALVSQIPLGPGVTIKRSNKTVNGRLGGLSEHLTYEVVEQPNLNIYLAPEIDNWAVQVLNSTITPGRTAYSPATNTVVYSTFNSETNSLHVKVASGLVGYSNGETTLYKPYVTYLADFQGAREVLKVKGIYTLSNGDVIIAGVDQFISKQKFMLPSALPCAGIYF